MLFVSFASGLLYLGKVPAQQMFQRRSEKLRVTCRHLKFAAQWRDVCDFLPACHQRGGHDCHDSHDPGQENFSGFSWHARFMPFLWSFCSAQSVCKRDIRHASLSHIPTTFPAFLIPLFEFGSSARIGLLWLLWAPLQAPQRRASDCVCSAFHEICAVTRDEMCHKCNKSSIQSHLSSETALPCSFRSSALGLLCSFDVEYLERVWKLLGSGTCLRCVVEKMRRNLWAELKLRKSRIHRNSQPRPTTWSLKDPLPWTAQQLTSQT